LGLTVFSQISSFAAGSVVLAWDASPDASVTGYRVYYGRASGTYTNSAAVGNVTTTTISNLADGATYYFAAVAFDASGAESEFSNETTYTVPAAVVNQPPTLSALSAVTLNEDAPVQIVSLAGITSGSAGETQTLTVTATSSNPSLIPNPAVSYASPNSTGSLTFTPVANGFGSATITVTVNDGQAANNTFSRTFVVTVNAVNDTPTLNALGNLTINEDATVQTVNLTGISSGAANEAQALVVTASSSDPSLIPNPTVNYTSANTAGSLSFAPVANASGSATITVTVNDGQAANHTVTRTFTVTVTPVNDVPTLTSIANIAVEQNSGLRTVNLSGIGTGAANEVQTLIVSATSSNPALIPNPTVNYTSPNATGSLSFTPAVNGTGSATITVTVNDGQAANSTVTRTFTVTVTPVNQPPTLNAIADVNLAEDAGAQTVSLSGISAGGAGETQPLTVTATSSNPGLIPNPTVSYASANATGNLNFTPIANANGVATITVTVNDGQPTNNLVTRTFLVTVNAVNDAPTLNALANANISGNAGSQTVNLSGITSGATNENQTLTVTATSSNPSLIPHPTVNYTSPNATGSLSYAPAANVNGSAVITVTVNDGQAANNSFTRTFTITVNVANNPPTLAALSNVSIGEDAAAQTVNLSGISAGAGENQTLTVTATSSNPSLIPNPTVNYSSPSATGSLNFAPVTDANGSATITVTVNDGQAISNTVSRTFTVTVTPVNDAPTLNPLASLTVDEDSGAQAVALTGIGTGAANETQTLTVTAVSSNPALIPNPTVSYSSPSATGNLNFTPAANASGSATITVTVNDGQAANSTVTQTFTVTVNPVNDAPTLNVIANLGIPENAGPQTVNLSGIGTGAANESQTLTITAVSSNPGLIPHPTVNYNSPNATGSLAFTPAANSSGSAAITVTINDGQPQNNTLVRTFVVSVNLANNPPTLAAIGNVTISEDAAAQTVNLTGITSGSATENQALTVTAVSSNPALIPNPTVNYTSPNATGSLSFTPVANANGAATVTVTVNDGHAVSNLVTRTFIVSVNAVNDAPTLNPLGNLTISEDAGLQSVGLAGISTGAANETQTLTVTAVSSNPSLIPHPTVSYASPAATGNLNFTPVANASGTATITVTVNDGQAVNNTVTQTFTVTVTPVNDAPTLNALADLTIQEDAPAQTVTLSGITSGAANENQTLTVTATSSNPALIPNPTVNYNTPNTGGSLSFTPLTNATGTATITVTVNDGQATNNTLARTFVVTVNAVNDLPTISPIANLSLVSGTNSGPISFTVDDAETAATALTVTRTSSNPTLLPVANIILGGSAANRTVSLASAVGQTGISDVTLTVNDGTGTRSTTFRVTVTAPPPQVGQLAVNKSGSGTVSPDLSTMELIVGQSYTVTATPAQSYLFNGWTGSIQSSSPTITFTMTANMVLQANFVVDPYVAAAGTYNGLFNEADEVRLATAGAFNLYVDGSGNFSAWLQIGYARYPFSGKLDLNLRATNVVTRFNAATPVTVELQAGQGATAGQIWGRVTDGAWTAALSAGRPAAVSALAGEYTVVIPGASGNAALPAGDGYATLHVATDGLGTLSATLADGTQFSQSAYVTTDGDWPLFVSMYIGQGAVISWLSFTNLPSSDVSGDLVWIKRPGASTTSYPAGFTLGTKAIGSRYVAPPAGEKAVNLSGAVVSFSGGNLGSAFNNVVSVNAGSQVVNLSPNQLSLGIATGLGTFSGQVLEPGTSQLRNFGGVILQKQNAGYGSLTGPSLASRVVIGAP